MQAFIFYVVFDIFLLNPSDDAESYDHSALMLFFGGNPTLISIFGGLIYFLTFWDFVFFFLQPLPGLVIILIVLILTWAKWSSGMDLVFSSLMAKDVEHFLVNVTCGNSCLPKSCLWSQLNYCMLFDTIRGTYLALSK